MQAGILRILYTRYGQKPRNHPGSHRMLVQEQGVVLNFYDFQRGRVMPFSFFRKLYHPELFQGSLKRKRYFEGWYFKQVSQDCSRALACIPGIALGNDPHAFVQVLDGVAGKSWYFRYPVNDFQWDRRRLSVAIGKNSFTREGLRLDLVDKNVRITGELAFEEVHSWSGRLFAPGIMGPYSFVPFMECYHGVVSLGHSLQGRIRLQEKEIDFSGGRGYIEKDWGRSFPECWIWVQCNGFPDQDVSLMLSVAKIPWLGHWFLGHLCFLRLGNKVFRFSRYNGARLDSVIPWKNGCEVRLRRKGVQLCIQASARGSGELAAPRTGDMERPIKESIDATVAVTLRDKTDAVLFQESGRRAGLEVVGAIFKHFTQQVF